MQEINFILNFLSELKENNQKEWMDAHKQQYQQARQAFIGLVGELLEGMKGFDSSLEGIQPKDCIFRINRDIRFSADKTPYKVWLSAVMAEGGKKTLQSIYYLHLQPGGESMVAGGIHQPAGEQLRKIRQEVDYNAAELREIVNHPDFLRYFGEIQGEKLSRAPKGYPIDHPNIEFLKLKSYLAIRKFKDEEVIQKDFVQEVLKTYRAVQPFNEYLNIAVS
jgi:uncharacterized protein (TIGR02453 family)